MCSNRHNGKSVYRIDSVLTIIDSVRGDVAKGFILNDDLTLEPCFVVKQDDLFAHGESLHKAQEALQDKLFEEYDEETRIEKFKEEFPDSTKKYPAKQFFIWHNKLTGSCEQGRKNFCQSKQIDIEKDEFTVSEFVRITKESYRGDVISKIVNHQI